MSRLQSSIISASIPPVMKIPMLFFGLMVIAHAELPKDSLPNVALLIGNNKYQHASDLANPINDVTSVAKLLKQDGWKVTIVTDGSEKSLRKSIIKFSKTPAQKSLFYYAGHGLEVDKQNYLVPSDATLTERDDLEVETLSLKWVLSRLNDSEQGLKMVVLDCCRNNPFQQQRAWLSGRSMGKGGLAKVSQELLGIGTMVVYSGAPGNTVPDGSGLNSPFTSAFLKELPITGRVSYNEFVSAISKRIKSKQKPWVKFDGATESFSAFNKHSLLAKSKSPTSPKSKSGDLAEVQRKQQETAEQLEEIRKLLQQQSNKDQGNNQALLDRITQLEKELADARAKEEKIKTRPDPAPNADNNHSDYATKKQALQQFIDLYWNSLPKDGGACSALYALQVDYQYKKSGMANRSYLRKSFNENHRRWPIRTYKLEGKINFSINGSQASFRIPYHYSYRDYRGKRASGYATDTLGLNWRNGNWEINKYRQSVSRTRLDK